MTRRRCVLDEDNGSSNLATLFIPTYVNFTLFNCCLLIEKSRTPYYEYNTRLYLDFVNCNYFCNNKYKYWPWVFFFISVLITFDFLFVDIRLYFRYDSSRRPLKITKRFMFIDFWEWTSKEIAEKRTKYFFFKTHKILILCSTKTTSCKCII